MQKFDAHEESTLESVELDGVIDGNHAVVIQHLSNQISCECVKN